ncbi:hypothetical protein [Kordia jejudonensis]|uniref:hypothetical protein n=1 Tax=Kordia jejudonensis TaxID=1348245 RepID=UPI0006293BE0|nr:hypothetical protein [Kordia jejudonensis]
MKNLVLHLSLFLISQNVLSQTNEKNTYLIFDNLSNQTYSFEIGNGKIGTEKIFRKEKKKEGNIKFYIKKEMFLSNKKQSDTCTIDNLKNIKVSKIEDLKKDVNKINPLYPYEVFPNLYLVEKINDSTIVKYKVKWQYYIE